MLPGQPETPAWTKLSDDGERATFYAGTADVELYRTETGFYRDNLASGAPSLWVALRAADGEPPFTVAAVTADPAEGESLTETATDLVEQVPMPGAIQHAVAAFVAEHHVEQPFVKRKRDRANPEAMARRDARRRSRMSEPENFLTRWSRRKRVAEEPDRPAPATEAAPEKPRTGRRARPANRKTNRRLWNPSRHSIRPACRRSIRSAH